ncbi:MAG: TRAP transporter small permease subunit [Thalassotalea sp.]|nr:TRAP transporter small permease subunit [Thalassotalea sp.]
MQLIINLLKKVIDAIGYLCSILMILMIVNVFYDVIMRYFFNDVSIAMQELEWHLFAGMFMFGIGYTLKGDGHVRVDVFYDRFSSRAKALVNILGSLFFALPITLLTIFYSWDYTLEAYQMGEGSADPGGLPHRWVIRSVIPISSTYLVICIIYVLIHQLQTLLKQSQLELK